MNHFKQILLPLVFILSFCACNSSGKEANSKQTEEINTEQTDAIVSISAETFFHSVLNGNKAIVEKGLSGGITVDSMDDAGNTALMLASFNGHTELVKLLLNEGADVNKTSEAGRTALMYAASGPFAPTVEVLLNSGAEVNKTDDVEHFTALMFAASEGHLPNVKLLVDAGADKRLKDIDGDTAYTFAVDNGHAEVAGFLK